MNVVLKELKADDYAWISELYNHYIRHSTATFHLEPLSAEDMQQMIPMHHPKYPACTIEWQGSKVGYVYLAPYKPRQAYNRTAEITLYLHPDFHKKGIGTQVLKQMEGIAKSNEIINLLAVITAENTGSVKLFQSNGYQPSALLKEVGEKFGKVLDVLILQKLLY